MTVEDNKLSFAVILLMFKSLNCMKCRRICSTLALTPELSHKPDITIPLI